MCGVFIYSSLTAASPIGWRASKRPAWDRGGQNVSTLQLRELRREVGSKSGVIRFENRSN